MLALRAPLARLDMKLLDKMDKEVALLSSFALVPFLPSNPTMQRRTSSFFAAFSKKSSKDSTNGAQEHPWITKNQIFDKLD